MKDPNGFGVLFSTQLPLGSGVVLAGFIWCSLTTIHPQSRMLSAFQLSQSFVTLYMGLFCLLEIIPHFDHYILATLIVKTKKNKTILLT